MYTKQNEKILTSAHLEMCTYITRKQAQLKNLLTCKYSKNDLNLITLFCLFFKGVFSMISK